MNLKAFIIIISLMIIAMVSTCIYNIISDNKSAEIEAKTTKQILGNLQFKGRVINSKIFKYGGKNYFMVCISLDYSNVKEFYVLNQYCCLKIKNGIATMPVGFYNESDGFPKYVEFNMNNSNIEKFIRKDGDTYQKGLSCYNYDLTKDDMRACN